MQPTRTAVHVDAVAIDGPDARRFAQAQFCGDLRNLGRSSWRWNAWLDEHGRVRALAQLVDVGDEALLAVLRGGNADEVRDELARYVLRLRVKLSVRRFAGAAGPARPLGEASTGDDGVLTLGFGDRGLRLTLGPLPVDAEANRAWRLADIRAGWPTLPRGGARFLPPALALERLGAIAFDKGCYPGQEIAARLRRARGHKYVLCHLRGDAGAAPERGRFVSIDTGASRIRLLDWVEAGPAMEMLAVIPIGKATSRSINVLQYDCVVVSRFHP